MAVVYKKQNETIEDLIKRFRRKVETEGIMKEIRKREFYQKPSEIRAKTLKKTG